VEEAGSLITIQINYSNTQCHFHNGNMVETVVVDMCTQRGVVL